MLWQYNTTGSVDASTTNAPKAVEYISSHTNAEAYLDNDKTGRKCLSRLQESCPGTRFWDASGLYAEHNDLNEHLLFIINLHYLRNKLK